MTGKKIEALDEKECGRLRDWIDKVYEKRLSEQKLSGQAGQKPFKTPEKGVKAGLKKK